MISESSIQNYSSHCVTALFRMTKLQYQCFKTFERFRNPQDRMIDALIRANGGPNEVMADDIKCAALLKLQNDLTTTHNIQSAKAAGPALYKAREGGDPASQLAFKNEIAALRKEYCTDVATLIEDNKGKCLNNLNLRLHLLSEDIKGDVRKEADRVIDYMKEDRISD
ncbi:hypothetical protein MVEN_01179700 [Mycena venus]|uniref:Uncharacterized protein n=1 Tax=Mycena venus TaxID=2733690 RepID=A0A8H7CVT0_9AGAR|nr:hypothetical protein MVEN_01179700 [Mycena venus]